MTVDTTVTDIQFNGGGIPYDFEFPAKVFNLDDLAVSRRTNLSSDYYTLTRGVDYEVTIDVYGIATVSLVSALVSGEVLDIRSNTALTQPTSIRTLTRFQPEIHESAFDRLSRQIQDLARKVRGSLRFRDIDDTDGEFGSVEDRKGKYLFFNAVTGAVEYVVNLAITTLSQSLIAQLLNPLTPAEIAAGVVVTNFVRQPGDIRRYGAIDGADSTVAIAASFSQMQRAGGAAVYIPIGDFTSTTSNVVTYTGWRVHGEDGVRSIIRYSGTGAGLVISGLFGTMNEVGLYNSGSVNNGLVLHNAGGSSFYDVLVGGGAFGFDSDGVVIAENYTTPKGNNNNARFFNCLSSNNAGCGFSIPSTGLDHNDIEWFGCNAGGNGSHGLLLKGQANRVWGGIFEGNAGYGIQISESGDSGDSTRSVINYPYLESNTLGGVRGGGKSLNNQVYLDGLNANSSYTRAAGSEDFWWQPNNSGGPFLQMGDPAAFFRMHSVTTGAPRLGITADGSTTNIPIYITSKGTGGTILEGANDSVASLVYLGQKGTGIRDLVHGQATFAAGTTVAVAFGYNLPSASYKVFPGGSANKTFWATSKTVSGFTLNASSPSSDTVDWMVVL